MKFELWTACSYLIPTRANWSRSSMSILSILVVSSVVWLSMVFLSVSAGLKQLWIKKLISIDAPIRIRPTDSYFDSYFYNIDSLSQNSGYQNKTLIQKLQGSNCDPYDHAHDGPMPIDLQPPDLDEIGLLKNPVKSVVKLLSQMQSIDFADSSSALSNFTIEARNRVDLKGDLHRRSFQQMSLVVPLIWQKGLKKQLQKISDAQWAIFFDNWFNTIASRDPAERALIWRHLKIASVLSRPEGLTLLASQFPQKGSFEAIVFGRFIHLCSTKAELRNLAKRFGENGYRASVDFSNGKITVKGSSKASWSLIYHGSLQPIGPPSSSGDELNWRQIPISLKLNIQGSDTIIKSSLGQLIIQKVQAQKEDCETKAIIEALQERNTLSRFGEGGSGQEIFGALLPNQYRRNGIEIGDLGCLQNQVLTPSGAMVEDFTLMVCGFFDAAMMPHGSKLIVVEPQCCSLLHEAMPEVEQRNHCGFSIFCHLDQVNQVTYQIQEKLKEIGLDRYWSVQCYEDFEHIRDLLTQLKGDQLLLGVLAVIIIAVACSNIISMLLLLVIEKKHEIAIFRALGASSGSIAGIFSLCGFLTGSISGLLGTFMAWITLTHIDALARFLSWLGGRQLFHPLYYGDNLPDQMTFSAIIFTLIITAVFSALAALIPARSAAGLNPSKLLREG